MRKLSKKLKLNSPRPEGQSTTDEPEVFHNGAAPPSGYEEKEVPWELLHLMDILSGAYAMLISTLGLVLPLTMFLVPEYNYKQHGAYITVFHVYVYVTALAAMTFMAITGNAASRKKQTETHLTHGSVALADGQVAPPIYEGIEETNFFLRIGLVAFSLCGGLMEGFRLMSFLEEDSGRMWNCFGVQYMVVGILRLIFIIFQTFTVFKYHRMVINQYHAMNKMCTMHLIATNMCTWALTVILEAVEAYQHVLALRSGHHRRSAAPPPDTDHSNSTATHDTALSSVCVTFPNTLATLAGPYLFPFIIEYSLLAAAILYNSHSRIGHEEYLELKETLEDKKEEKKKAIEDGRHKESAEVIFTEATCSKAHSGLFLGLTLFIVVGVACCFFLYIKTSKGTNSITSLIHIMSDISITCIAGITTLFAFWKTSKLHFVGHLDNMLDQNLLVMALFGYYILLVFMAVAALPQAGKPGPYGAAGQILGAMALIDLIQITLQVLFIVDGLRRKAINDCQADEKPGRSIITFLLILNLALWLVNTFMLKESYGFTIYEDFYGALPWVIMLNLALPLAIYYRFHAAVCLSEIWLHAYKKVPLDRMLNKDLAHCGKIL